MELTQNNQSVSEFYTKIKTVWDSIDDVNPVPTCSCTDCSCDLRQSVLTKQQEQRLLQFLLKLNDKYSVVRAHIMMMQPLPTVSQAYRLIAQEESHKEISQTGSLNDSLAFAADRRSFDSYNSQKFFQSANSQTYQRPVASRPSFSGNFTGPRRPSKPGSNYFCTHCKVQGHSIDRCFQIHGFPPGFKGFKDKCNTQMAATVIATEPIDQIASSTPNTCSNNSLTEAQYSHLVSLLGSHLSTSHSTGAEQTSDNSSHALLAGKICLMSSSRSN